MFVWVDPLVNERAIFRDLEVPSHIAIGVHKDHACKVISLSLCYEQFRRAKQAPALGSALEVGRCISREL